MLDSYACNLQIFGLSFVSRDHFDITVQRDGTLLIDNHGSLDNVAATWSNDGVDVALPRGQKTTVHLKVGAMLCVQSETAHRTLFPVHSIKTQEDH